MLSADEEKEIETQTWNKLENNAKTNGYREGISDAKEQNFQKFFDQGYEEGLKNGFILGKLKGKLSTREINEEILKKCSQGNCLLCSTENDTQTNLSELINNQEESTQKVITNLENKYKLE